MLTDVLVLNELIALHARLSELLQTLSNVLFLPEIGDSINVSVIFMVEHTSHGSHSCSSM